MRNWQRVGVHFEEEEEKSCLGWGTEEKFCCGNFPILQKLAHFGRRQKKKFLMWKFLHFADVKKLQSRKSKFVKFAM